MNRKLSHIHAMIIYLYHGWVGGGGGEGFLLSGKGLMYCIAIPHGLDLYRILFVLTWPI